MAGELAAAYKSGSQRARVVTEAWARSQLYCANCDSSSLGETPTNNQAIDFVCPRCLAPFQLKARHGALGESVTDGAYIAMLAAIREDRTPNLLPLHYALPAWEVRELLLIPSFMLVGTARCAVRAAYQRRNVGRNSHRACDSFRPLLRGRGHRSAMSLPPPRAAPVGWLQSVGAFGWNHGGTEVKSDPAKNVSWIPFFKPPLTKPARAWPRAAFPSARCWRATEKSSGAATTSACKREA